MYKVTKELHFCYGHRLMQYQGKCRVPHGHNGKVAVDLVAESLDALGMVVDFTNIKRSIQGWIDSTLDHRMLLHSDDPLAKWLQEMAEPCFLMDQNPTAEAIAQLIFEYAAAQGFPVVEVRLWETPDSYASYRRSSATVGQSQRRE
ncbi:MAG TPA: 6-carboxytetrahydropterin synthase [Candidatus Binatia bacterium]|nr:6-carboxytetrahydropterin synthase [Candidatus Binatia bacterium]